MEPDFSQKHKPGSSILGDMQISLCDESLKRDASQMEEYAHKKSRKKRRSSLSAHRRSIAGDVISAFNIDTDSGSQTSTESGSQKSSTADSGQASQESDVPRLLPNPVNVQMDIIIEKMRKQITELDKERKEWNNLLKEYEQHEEESKELAANLTLSMADIPADVKELGLSDYITTKPLDLCSIHDRFNQLVLQNKLDRETCLQNLHLIKETVETIKNSNKYLSSCLYQATEEESKDNDDEVSQPSDARQVIINYLKYT